MHFPFSRLVETWLEAGKKRSVLRSGRRASEPWSFSFPRDHGKHDDFNTEWWYLSGNLLSRDGNEWGYQFAIFYILLSGWR